MTGTTQPPLERIPRPDVYEVPWFDGTTEESTGTGDDIGGMDL